jgi:hypothetical protein
MSEQFKITRFVVSNQNIKDKMSIIEFAKTHIKDNGFPYFLHFVSTHIDDKTFFERVDKDNDIFIWDPFVVYSNLELVKECQNSIVILEKPSIYLQKISKNNPFNEVSAINNSLYIIYINPDDVDITNDEWKLVVKDDMFLVTPEILEKLIRSIQINSPDKIDRKLEPKETGNKTGLLKNQINLT